MGSLDCRCNQSKYKDEENEVQMLHPQLTLLNDKPLTIPDELNFNKIETFNLLESHGIKYLSSRGLNTARANIISRILANKQSHLLNYFDELPNNNDKESYLSFLNSINYEQIDSLFHKFQENPVSLIKIPKMEEQNNIKKKYSFYINNKYLTEEEIESYKQIGLSIIAEHKIGILIIMSNNHLQNDLYGIQQNYKGRSLLEIFFERIEQIKKEAYEKFSIQQDNLKIYLLTNEQNHHAIVNFLKQNSYFGTCARNIACFSQECQPVINLNGKIMFSNKNKVCYASTGKGGLYKSMLDPQIRKDLNEQKFQYINIISIENIMANPLDPVFLGVTLSNQLEISIKCIESPKNEIYNFYGDSYTQEVTQYSIATKFYELRLEEQMYQDQYTSSLSNSSPIKGEDSPSNFPLFNQCSGKSKIPQLFLKNIYNMIISKNFIESLFLSNKHQDLFKQFSLQKNQFKCLDFNSNEQTIQNVWLIELSMLSIMQYSKNFGIYQVDQTNEFEEIQEIKEEEKEELQKRVLRTKQKQKEVNLEPEEKMEANLQKQLTNDCLNLVNDAANSNNHNTNLALEIENQFQLEQNKNQNSSDTTNHN